MWPLCRRERAKMHNFSLPSASHKACETDVKCYRLSNVQFVPFHRLCDVRPSVHIPVLLCITVTVRNMKNEFIHFHPDTSSENKRIIAIFIITWCFHTLTLCTSLEARVHFNWCGGRRDAGTRNAHHLFCSFVIDQICKSWKRLIAPSEFKWTNYAGKKAAPAKVERTISICCEQR